MPTYLSADTRASTVNQDGLIIEMVPEMKWLDPDKYALINISQQLGNVQARTRMKHEWRERRPRARVMYITTADTAAAGQITVSAADGDLVEKMVDHYLLRPSTGEIMLYQSEAAGVLTVLDKDGAGSSAPLTATVVGEKIVILNNSHAEGEAPGDAFSQQEDSYYNYMTEIIRTINASNLEQLEEHYGEDQRQADQRGAMIETFRDYDLQCWYGKRTRETTSQTGRRRHMIGGIMERIGTNVTDMTGTGGFTYAQFCECLRPCTEHSQTSRHMFFPGTNAYMAVASWVENKLDTAGADKTYGVQIANVRTPYGEVPMVREIQFSGANGLADVAAILDMNQIVRTFMPAKTVTGHSTGGDLHMILNYDTSNPFISKDIITGIVGMEMYLEELAAKIVNIT